MRGQIAAVATAPFFPDPRWSAVRTIAALLAAAALLLWAAIFNGFPLIFPDSGTYLGIAFGREYAVDRSSMYGFLLKPGVGAIGGAGGLWLALAMQTLAVAAVLLAAVRRIAPTLAPGPVLGAVAALSLLTSLPWHAGQFMPDALSGPVLLLAWLAASRDPQAGGAPLLWLAAVAAATTHYTHLALLGTGAGSAILVHRVFGLPLRACLRRAAAAMLALALAAGALAAANGAVLGRTSVSPAGPLFLFARLHEDGLIPAWFSRRCGEGTTPTLCANRDRLPRDSQVLLWGGARTPLHAAVWHGDDATRWRWIDEMAIANRGAAADHPVAFMRSAARGTSHQLFAFAALDDECPGGCTSPAGGVAYILAKHRPETLAALRASRQARDTTGRALVRAVTTPVALVSLLLLPVALTLAWRRRDSEAAALLATVAAGLLVNAALAGALSDVHDRYQSRVVWLAPFALLWIGVRWRAEGRSRRPGPACGQTLSRSRISLPGLK